MITDHHNKYTNNDKVRNVRITKMCHRDTKWGNAIAKMELIDLGCHKLSSCEKHSICKVQTKERATKWDMFALKLSIMVMEFWLESAIEGDYLGGRIMIAMWSVKGWNQWCVPGRRKCFYIKEIMVKTGKERGGKRWFLLLGLWFVGYERMDSLFSMEF